MLAMMMSGFYSYGQTLCTRNMGGAVYFPDYTKGCRQ
jgi:hypothetical protein